MNGGRAGNVLEPFQTLFGAGTAAGLTDGQLLERFAGGREKEGEAAFAALVSRHGPMVRRACRSLIADPNDADDAFQATFLVLARKAGMIRRPELLGNWLYGTAHRAARTLRTRAARRRKHEAWGMAMADTLASTDPEEAQRQRGHPPSRRRPRSCSRGGRSAAWRSLAVTAVCTLRARGPASRGGCPTSSMPPDRTLRRRLDRARDLLRSRLTRRGLAPTAGVLAALLGPELASAAIPQLTVDATARAAIRFAAASAMAGIATARATVLQPGRSNFTPCSGPRLERCSRLRRAWCWYSGSAPAWPLV